MAPLILDIEEDKEDTDHHGDDDADNHKQATVHPAAGPQGVRFGFEHFVFFLHFASSDESVGCLSSSWDTLTTDYGSTLCGG